MRTRRKPARNRPCPCGRRDEWGHPVKYKRCCGHGDVRKRLAAQKASQWARFKGYMHRLWSFNRVEPAYGRSLQFVWWWSPRQWRLGWGRPWPPHDPVYRWRLYCGPLEVRRWVR